MKHANYNYLRVKLSAQIFKLLSKLRLFSINEEYEKPEKKYRENLSAYSPLPP